MSKSNNSLAILLAAIIVAVLGYTVYLMVTPKESEKFTEFYVLTAEGKTKNYPKQVVLGETVEVTLGIVNHEQKPTNYRVEVKTDVAVASEVNVGTLAQGEKWERKISFTPQLVGDKQTVYFYLYLDGENEPHLAEPLRLSLKVASP
jgi:uncharacterized membrane protein